MASLITNIPAYCFPHELDAISFSADSSVDIVLSTDLDRVELHLTPDAAGSILVEDLAGVLRDFTADGIARQVRLAWDGGSRDFVLLPCRRTLSADAVTFTYDRFLSLCKGEKPTYLQAVEYVHVYEPQGKRAKFSIASLWADPATGELKPAETSGDSIGSTAELEGNVFQFRFSPKDIPSPSAGLELLSFSVSCGQRRQDFAIRHTADAEPVTLAFRNCFGVTDTFHCFGTVQTEVKVTRDSASFGGRMYNYRVEAVPYYTAQTGILTKPVLELFSDICSATRVWLGYREGIALCVTDSELKVSNDLYEPQTGSVTWCECRKEGTVRSEDPAKVFDNTFDKTFF